MMNEVYVGVDGGATKSVIILADRYGKILGRAFGGPANIRISVNKTWDAIMLGVIQILNDCNLQLSDVSLHAVMGLAGVEIAEAKQEFLATSHPFQNLLLTSDAHIACLGAHAGSDGAVIVIGTGVVGYQIAANQLTKVSGWGFPHDDIGGGAWLGLEAMKLTIQSLDGRGNRSILTEAIYQHFNHNFNVMITWANQTNSSGFAELAPLVIQAAQQNDSAANKLLQNAAVAIDKVYLAMKSHLPCALIGGIAPFIQKYLALELQKHLVKCKMTPDEGAMLMARRKFNYA